MKKMQLQLIVMAAAMLLMAGTAMAAGAPAVLNVTAAVQGTCSISGPGALNFGALDPVLAPAVVATSTGISVTCANGTAFTVAASNGGIGTLSDGTNSFGYTLDPLPGGTGTGVAVPYNVTGRIAVGAYSALPANIYTDTVSLTVTP